MKSPGRSKVIEHHGPNADHWVVTSITLIQEFVAQATSTPYIPLHRAVGNFRRRILSPLEDIQAITEGMAGYITDLLIEACVDRLTLNLSELCHTDAFVWDDFLALAISMAEELQRPGQVCSGDDEEWLPENIPEDLYTFDDMEIILADYTVDLTVDDSLVSVISTLVDNIDKIQGCSYKGPNLSDEHEKYNLSCFAIPSLTVKAQSGVRRRSADAFSIKVRAPNCEPSYIFASGGYVWLMLEGDLSLGRPSSKFEKLLRRGPKGPSLQVGSPPSC